MKTTSRKPVFSGNEPRPAGAIVLRRASVRRKTEQEGRLGVGGATLVRDFHTLENGGKSVTLTALEVPAAVVPGRDVGKLLTRAQILERVWNDVSGVPTRVVDVHVARAAPRS